MKKKLISAMIYIYIAVVVGVVASAETITGLGVSFPIQQLLKSAYATADLDGYDKGRADNIDFSDMPKIKGVQAAIKSRTIGYSGFVFGADFDIGGSKIKDYDISYIDFNFDLAFGWAVVDTDRFTLIPSIMVGVHHLKSEGVKQSFEDNLHYYYNVPGIQRYTAFEVGVDLFANFRIGDCFGLFAACKFMFNVGNLRNEYYVSAWGETWTDKWHKTTAFVVKPSVGVSFMF